MTTNLKSIVSLLNDKTKSRTKPARLALAALCWRKANEGDTPAIARLRAAAHFSRNISVTGYRGPDLNELLSGFDTRISVLPNGEIRYSKNEVVNALVHSLNDGTLSKLKRCSCGAYYIKLRKDKTFCSKRCWDLNNQANGIGKRIHRLRSLRSYWKYKALGITERERKAKIRELSDRIAALQASRKVARDRA